MHRILFDVDRWDVYQHRAARDLPMVDKNDTAPIKFQDELFERLYTGDDAMTALPEGKQERSLKEWAKLVHKTADDMPDFKRMARDCMGNSFRSATAVNEVMKYVDDTMRKLEQQNVPLENKDGTPTSDVEAKVRRAVRIGSTIAKRRIEESEQAMEGMSGVEFGAGGAGCGGGTGTHAQGNTLAEVRDLVQKLRNDRRLAKIAMLAGRFKRIALRKAKSKVKHGADELTNIETGDDIGRLIPSELVKLTHKTLRLAFLRDWSEKRCLQYKLEGVEEKGRGPIVVCLDKSGSMNGDRDIWATAVALSLLDRAQREHRKFALLCFDNQIIYRSPVVGPNDKLPMDALHVQARGGTNFYTAIQNALETIKANPGQMSKSDIVLVTDGAGECFEMGDELKNARKELGVKVLGIAIGRGAEALAGWCDTAVGISDLNDLSDKAADALFAGE